MGKDFFRMHTVKEKKCKSIPENNKQIVAQNVQGTFLKILEFGKFDQKCFTK